MKNFKRYTVDRKEPNQILNLHIYLPKDAPDEITVRIS
jgi:hypothetical protein